MPHTDAHSATSATPNLSESSKREIAAELLRRRQARKSLLAFTEYTNPDYDPAVHHKLIIEKLEAVERGDIDRLMIQMPPRHGKSELASRRFPAWYLGRHPKRSIISASYNSELAGDFGREVRNIIADPGYRNLFDVHLAPDSKAANRWHTDNGGSYVAAGVGTAITGRGAHVLLIDDPIKDREEADSETQRDRIWDWYSSTAYTRLMPNAAVIVIQTRWHEDDLSGRLLEAMQRGGDQFEVLTLPALADDGDQLGRAPGDPLWPEWYGTSQLHRIRANTIPRDWQALFQQSPSPEEGNYFKRDWLRWYSEAPKHLRIYGASDFAVTDSGGDYTVHGIFGVDPDDNVYLLDMWREQAASDVWVESLIDLAEAWRPIQWAAEKGQIDRSVGPFLDKRMRERRTYVAIERFVSDKDKPTRAQAIRARMAMGKVYLPEKAEWKHSLMSELLAFPAARNDDMVDVLSLIGRMLNTMAGGVVQHQEIEVRDRWDKVFEDESESWKVL